MHPACLYRGVIIRTQMPHKCFIMTALFHCSMFLIPSPPSSFGKHTWFHATFAPFQLNLLPDQRNALKMLSTCLIRALGRIKIANQYTWIAKRMNLANWNLREEESVLLVQVFVLARYLVVSQDTKKLIFYAYRNFAGEDVALIQIRHQIRQLLKLLRLPTNLATEFSQQNISKSSARHKWQIHSLSHFKLNLKFPSSIMLFIRHKRPSILNTRGIETWDVLGGGSYHLERIRSTCH